MRRRLAAAMGLGLCLTLASSCVEQETGLDMDETFDQGRLVPVQDPLAFTDEPYDFTGQSPIEDLLGLYPEDAFVWYGYGPSDPYPVQGDCDPGRTNNVQPVTAVDGLPMTIEGVVTLHPRYFQKISFCGSDERYQGSYILQDATGGILVLRDARTAPFDYGDRVRLRVRGLIKYFDTKAVVAFDQEEVLTNREDRYPLYYEAVDRPFLSEDVGKVRRIRGKVVGEATNSNFNEAQIEALDGSGTTWLVSFDRELGTRRVSPPGGAVVELTGPILNSFGLRMIIASLGQIEYLDEP